VGRAGVEIFNLTASNAHREVFFCEYSTISTANYCVSKVYSQVHIYLGALGGEDACQTTNECDTGHWVYVISKLQHYISDYLFIQQRSQPANP